MTVPQAKRLAAERSKAHETSFLIFSDVHLDNSKTVAALKQVLDGYEGLDTVDQPSLFVFFGNFRSQPFLFDGESSREYEGAPLEPDVAAKTPSR